MSVPIKFYLLFFVFLAGSGFAWAAENSIHKVSVDFFYKQGCLECERIEEEVFPELEEQLSGFYEIHKLEIGVESHYAKLLGYFDRIGKTCDEPVSMVLEGRELLCGFSDIEEHLISKINECLQIKLDPAESPVRKGSVDGTPSDPSVLMERFKKFTFLGVMTAGLIDGINPCAIGTLLFFLSFLSLLKVPLKKLWVLGSVYCLVSFLTYLALGLGVLHVFGSSASHTFVLDGIRGFFVLLLFIFSALSFRDAYQFRVTGSGKALALKLPDFLIRKIHDLIRHEKHSAHLVFSSAFLAFAVTLIESVCTGQVYLPTLMWVFQKGYELQTSLTLLVVYNGMFVLPMGILFLLFLGGRKMDFFIRFSKTNAVVSKLLTGCFFLILGVLLIVT